MVAPAKPAGDHLLDHHPAPLPRADLAQRQAAHRHGQCLGTGVARLARDNREQHCDAVTLAIVVSKSATSREARLWSIPNAQLLDEIVGR
jgi:hypothetical protein